MRERLPDRRHSAAFGFEYEGHRYRASVGRFGDGRLAEIFLDTGKVDSPLQKNAETSAVLVSLLLQHGVSAGEILRSISGPIAVALEQVEGSRE